MKIVYGVNSDRTPGVVEWDGKGRDDCEFRGSGAEAWHRHVFTLSRCSKHFTVAENVHWPGRQVQPARWPIASRSFAALMACPWIFSSHAHGMSLGERQAWKIVRCLLQVATVLIMDDPTSVLTPKAVRRCSKTLRGWRGMASAFSNQSQAR